MHTLASQKIVDDIVRTGRQAEAQRRHAVAYGPHVEAADLQLLGHPLRRAVQVTNQGVGSLGREKVHAQVSRAQRGLYPIPACIGFQRYGTNLVELPLVAHLERQGTGESVPGQIHPVQIATVYTTVDTDLSESFGQTAAQIQSQLQSLVRSGDSPGQVVVPESRFQTDSPVVEPVVVELPDLQRSIGCGRRR